MMTGLFNDNSMNREIVHNHTYFSSLDPTVCLFGWYSCNVVKSCKVLKILVTSVNCRQKLMIRRAGESVSELI